jgi:hypothetical protein
LKPSSALSQKVQKALEGKQVTKAWTKDSIPTVRLPTPNAAEDSDSSHEEGEVADKEGEPELNMDELTPEEKAPRKAHELQNRNVMMANRSMLILVEQQRSKEPKWNIKRTFGSGTRIGSPLQTIPGNGSAGF